MSEVNGKTRSIYFRIDEGVIEHNNRIFIAKNMDGKRVWDNIRAYSVSFSTISIIACIRITSVNSLVSVFLYDGGFVQFEGLRCFNRIPFSAVVKRLSCSMKSTAILSKPRV